MTSEEDRATFAAEDSSRGDVPGAPTWPILPGVQVADAGAPPVGLNWTSVADRLGLDRRFLEHDGAIVLAGEYFPEAGYFLDPVTLKARFVDVGEIALRRGYFLGELALRDTDAALTLDTSPAMAAHPIVLRDSGPIIGLFNRPDAAERACRRLLRGSLAAGIVTAEGPLGIEVHIRHAELPGRVASVIAGEGGAVISVGGQTIQSEGSTGVMATGAGTGMGDEPRGGTGATSGSPGPDVR